MNYQWQWACFTDLTPRELYAFLRLRHEVFALEQDCLYLDLDGLDQQAAHLMCWKGDVLLGYLRSLPPGLSYAESALGRIVTAPAGRGLGLGRELVKRGIAYNLRQWPKSGIRINAQAYLEDFYTSLGFVAEGSLYDEDGIPHQQMLYVRPPAET